MPVTYPDNVVCVKFDVFPTDPHGVAAKPEIPERFRACACPHAARVLLRWCAYAIRCRVTLRVEPVFSNISKASRASIGAIRCRVTLGVEPVFSNISTASRASLGAGDGEAVGSGDGEAVGSGDGEAVGSGDGEAWREDILVLSRFMALNCANFAMRSLFDSCLEHGGQQRILRC